MKRAQNSSVFCVWSQIILFQKSKISSQKTLNSCHRQSEASGSGSPGSLGRKVVLRRSAGDGFQCSADGWRLRAVTKMFGFDFPSGQALHMGKEAVYQRNVALPLISSTKWGNFTVLNFGWLPWERERFCQPITTAPSSRGWWTSTGCNPYLPELGDKQITMLDNTCAEWLT